MKFKYSARTKKGELQVGFVEAANREAAFNILSGHDLYILSLEPEITRKFLGPFGLLANRVRRKDLMIFTRQFATLLEAEISLSDSLKSLYAQTRNPVLKDVIFEISSDVDAGLSLSQALERHGSVFSEFYVNLVRSAEITGKIDEAMSFLANYLEKDINLTTRIRNALIYPGFILGLFVIVVLILVISVFPQLRPIFEESGVRLPLITQIVLGFGGFIVDWWWVIILIGAVGLFVAIDYFRSREGRIVLDQIILNFPIIGSLFKKVYITRFAEAAHILLRGGIPMAQAIEISGHTIDSISYRDTLHEVSDDVRRGDLLSRALAKNSAMFPPLVSQMVAVGESTGRLEEMLTRIASFYAREVDSVVANLVELIQPAVMVLIGVFVGLLFASLLIPIYNLAQGF